MRTFIKIHLGLGDAIACAAIVVKYAMESESVTIPCWKHNIKSVESLFVNYPNVKILPIEKDDYILILYDKIIELGYYNKSLPQLPNEDFVQWFYRQAGMTMEDKVKYCPIKEAAKNINQVEFKMTMWPYPPCNFIHTDRERGYEIKPRFFTQKPFKVAVNYKGSILSHVSHLENAKEIHCIDSSFLHLAEALQVKGKKYYHKYARPNSTDFKYLKGWEVIE